MTKIEDFHYFEPALELGGILAELRDLCSTNKEWRSFLRDHQDIDNMVRKWNRWVKLLHSGKHHFQVIQKGEKTTEWKVPELPFSEQERDYLSSPLLDELTHIGGQGPVEALCTLCRRGNLEVLKWLYANVNSYVCPYLSFEIACQHGHVDVLDWLKYKMINPYVNRFELFRTACDHSQLQVLDWLHENYYYPKKMPYAVAEIHYVEAFESACRKGKISVVRWLYQRYPDISEYYWFSDFFKGACAYGHLETVVWLHETFPQYDLFRVRSYMTPEIRNHFYPN